MIFKYSHHAIEVFFFGGGNIFEFLNRSLHGLSLDIRIVRFVCLSLNVLSSFSTFLFFWGGRLEMVFQRFVIKIPSNKFSASVDIWLDSCILLCEFQMCGVYDS